jgi:hypothetical protein
MKLPAIAALSLALCCVAKGLDDPNGVKARTVYHANGTHTESIHDPTLHEQREYTYDQRNVLVSKKVYLLNDRGQAMQGNIYDGRDVLKARVSILFDDLGRMIEERMTNLQGEVYQTISFTYDAQGKALPPKSRTYSVKGPDMKPAVVDFTHQEAAPAPMDRSQGADKNTFGNVPRLPAGAPGRPAGSPAQPMAKGAILDGAPTTEAADAPKKRGFWQSLLGKDKDKDKKADKK